MGNYALFLLLRISAGWQTGKNIQPTTNPLTNFGLEVS